MNKRGGIIGNASSTSKIHDPRYMIQDTLSKIHDPRYMIQDTWYKISDPRYMKRWIIIMEVMATLYVVIADNSSSTSTPGL